MSCSVSKFSTVYKEKEVLSIGLQPNQMAKIHSALSALRECK